MSTTFPGLLNQNSTNPIIPPLQISPRNIHMKELESQESRILSPKKIRTPRERIADGIADAIVVYFQNIKRELISREVLKVLREKEFLELVDLERNPLKIIPLLSKEWIHSQDINSLPSVLKVILYKDRRMSKILKGIFKMHALNCIFKLNHSIDKKIKICTIPLSNLEDIKTVKFSKINLDPHETMNLFVIDPNLIVSQQTKKSIKLFDEQMNYEILDWDYNQLLVKENHGEKNSPYQDHFNLMIVDLNDISSTDHFFKNLFNIIKLGGHLILKEEITNEKREHFSNILLDADEQLKRDYKQIKQNLLSEGISNEDVNCLFARSYSLQKVGFKPHRQCSIISIPFSSNYFFAFNK